MVLFMKRLPNVLALCAVAVLLSSAAHGADANTDDPKLKRLGPLAGKLDRRLIPALQALRGGTSTAPAISRSLQLSLGRTLPPSPAGKLPLTLDVPHVNAATLKAITGTGATVVNSSAQWNTVTALATLEEVDALTRLADVRVITLAHRPSRRQQGAANNQGDGSMKAAQARQQTGLTGAGTKIGVVSDFINKTNLADGVGPIGPGTVTGTAPTATLTNMTNQTSGDLPAQIQVVDFGPDPGSVPPAPDNYTIPFASNEGAAMMELMHDVAPNASFAFASGFYNQSMMASNMLLLRDAGCKIIVDDFGYPDEPFFQDGPIAQAIQANVAAGVTHFVAAGNDGDQGVLATYTPVNGAAPNDPDPINPTGNFFHNWGIGGTTPGFLPIDIPDGTNATFILQWNQPFSRYSLGPGSSVDLDMFLYDGTDLTMANVMAFSNDPQFANSTPSGDPLELIDFSNTSGSTQRVYLTVNHFAGTRSNVRLRLVMVSDTKLSFPSNGVGGMTTYGHAAVSEAITVGAVFFGDIDSGGLFPLDAASVNAEEFTSKGGIGGAGVPYYFDTAGAPLPGVVLRDSPDIAGPDGGNTTFFGDSTSHFEANGVTYGSDDFPKFFGTSAAASNCAAATALVLERASLTTPAQLKAALKSLAADVVAFAPPSSAGPDDRTGAGLIDALAVINAMPGVLTQPADQSINVGQSATFSIIAGGNATLLYQWQKDGTDIPGQTAPTLTLDNVPAGDDGTTYRCFVTNPLGKAVSKSALLSVHLPPVITGQPADQVVILGGTATFSVQAIHAPLTYQWQRDTVDIPGAILATYSLVGVGPGDDMAQFRCVVKNPYGTVTSDTAVLTVNANPAITSGPTAVPLAARVGEDVQFTVAAIGAHDQPLTYLWIFGDGTSASGDTVAHAYAAPQKYTVTVKITDTNNATTTATLSVIVFVDNDGDNLPDLDPNGNNEQFVDAYKTVASLTAQPLDVKKMGIGVNFAKSGTDTMTISGTLLVPAGFVALNKTVVIVIGGVGRTFTLDAKGKSKALPNGTLKLTFNARKIANPQFGKYMFKLSKADFKANVADEGITNRTTKNEGLTVRTTIFFNAQMYDKFQPQIYTSKLNKTGKTK